MNGTDGAPTAMDQKQHTADRNRSLVIKIAAIALIVLLLSPHFMKLLGHWLVKSELPDNADAAVVLNSGTELFPRLIQAALLYRQGLVKKVVINGDRKTDAIRRLESEGYQSCCEWYENHVRILVLKGVSRQDIITVSAEDAFDTISEAQAVGSHMLELGLEQLVITTSKFHTRRAQYIWQKLFGQKMKIYAAAAEEDPFSPDSWWQDGRQIRWVLAEYGAWIYYFYNQIFSEMNAPDEE